MYHYFDPCTWWLQKDSKTGCEVVCKLMQKHIHITQSETGISAVGCDLEHDIIQNPLVFWELKDGVRPYDVDVEDTTSISTCISFDDGFLQHRHWGTINHIRAIQISKTARQIKMASRFSQGDYVAQIFAYEDDTLRLLHNVQQHVAAGNALYAAVFLCRFSANPSAIEKSAIAEASSHRPHLDHDRSIDTTSAAHQGPIGGDLTLTLLHIDTTWRFDDFENRQASPNLSWPVIRKFYSPGAFSEGDLILRDQYCHPDAGRIPPPAAHLLHVEIVCYGEEGNGSVKEIARRLRTDVLYWTRQLLFELDPAQADTTVQAQRPQDGARYALVMETDTRHTAGSLASSVDTVSLRRLSGEHVASALVRVFSLEGSATYHDMTPRNAEEAPIDNRTYDGALDSDMTSEPAYFGLSPKSYVHT